MQGSPPGMPLGPPPVRGPADWPMSWDPVSGRWLPTVVTQRVGTPDVPWIGLFFLITCAVALGVLVALVVFEKLLGYQIQSSLGG